MDLKRFQAHWKLSQSTIEYAVLILVFATAVLAMFQYTKAGIRAKFKFLGDEMRSGMTEDITGDVSWSVSVDWRVYNILSQKLAEGTTRMPNREYYALRDNVRHWCQYPIKVSPDDDGRRGCVEHQICMDIWSIWRDIYRKMQALANAQQGLAAGCYYTTWKLCDESWDNKKVAAFYYWGWP